MLRRRHQNKSKSWLYKKYWTAGGKHVFSIISRYKEKTRIMKVVRVSSIGVKRHIKIKADANPYLPEFGYYFWRRKNVKGSCVLDAMSHREYQAKMA